MVEGEAESCLNVSCGAKSVHVNDESREGIAMNMNVPPGQICKWFGEMAKDFSVLGAREEAGRDTAGIWNSHHKVSMYSCW